MSHNEKKERVQIMLYASRLPGKQSSDPFAVVTLLSNNPNDEPKVLGKTEVIKKTLSPKWTTTFQVDFAMGETNRINVGIYDESGTKNSKHNKPMGSVVFDVQEVLASTGSMKAKTLKNGGTVFIRITKASMRDEGLFKLDMRGVKLKNVEPGFGVFRRSDPFFEIATQMEGAAGLQWQPVYRSTHIDNELNPHWPPMSISVNTLCGTAINRGTDVLHHPIRISVFDHEKSGKHVSMGHFETTLETLTMHQEKLNTSTPFKLTKNNKGMGDIVIVEATIENRLEPVTTGMAPTPIIPTPVAVAASSTASSAAAGIVGVEERGSDGNFTDSFNKTMDAPVAQYAKSVLPLPPPQAQQPLSQMVEDEGEIDLSTGEVFGGVLPLPTNASGIGNNVNYKSQQSPTFVDYVAGGLELSMITAIDFTGSNGDPRKPGTLHYSFKNGEMNDYEKAITAVGGVIARYDHDQKFPVLGFGAKFRGIINHCFQVGPEIEVSGISGIIQAYKNVFRMGFTMSGPTVFADVINYAASQARYKESQAQREGKQAYSVLLILTDGAVTDIEQTKMAIQAANNAPLSIVIVGIGQADFSKMQFLDDFQQFQQHQGSRDIVQFVEFSRHKNDKSALTRETLDEIPGQVVDYFYKLKGVMPLPPVSGSKLKLSAIETDDYNEDVDIDLNIEFDPNNSQGEIRLQNNVGAVVDDTKYSTLGDVMSSPATGAAAAGAMAPPFNPNQTHQPPPSASAPPAFNPNQQQSPPPAFNPNQQQQQYASSAPPAYHQQQQQQAPPGAQSPFNQSFSPGNYIPQHHHPPQPPGRPAGHQAFGHSVMGGGGPPPPGASLPGQQRIFHVQVPPGVAVGQKLQITHPFTHQPMIVTVPPGVPPGGKFGVRY